MYIRHRMIILSVIYIILIKLYHVWPKMNKREMLDKWVKWMCCHFDHDTVNINDHSCESCHVLI